MAASHLEIVTFFAQVKRMIKQITCTFFGCIDSIPIPVGFPACDSAQGHFGMYFGFERLILVLFENASIQIKNN